MLSSNALPRMNTDAGTIASRRTGHGALLDDLCTVQKKASKADIVFRMIEMVNQEWLSGRALHVSLNVRMNGRVTRPYFALVERPPVISMDFARTCLNAGGLDRRQLQRQQAVAGRFANGAVLAVLRAIIVCIPPLIPPDDIVPLTSANFPSMEQLKTPNLPGSLNDIAKTMMRPMPLPGTVTGCGNVNHLSIR
ncbi:unnamed protein product (mitochondrion) [Plasmodiophora brassicae]|uniref:Uncharacterized protein n=1 Tax=Plasmodiophora brassicae TaxID=37360 RepID=A0A3P3YA36_PLABS|nr:unnamed protein product [Plasmodiophora brassicae]